MTNKKYLPSVIVLYLNYFLHGIGCSILGQVAIKEALSASWNVEVMAITAISAALGFGRLIALPFAGPLSDKLGRRFSTAIGGFAYAAYLIGLALAFNMGGGTGYKVAYVCAIIGGIANSFLDTGIYPGVAEIIDKAPGVATIGIKFAISGSQLLLPFFLGIAVGQTTGGLVSYNALFYVVGVGYLILMALILFLPLPDSDAKKGAKKEGTLCTGDSVRNTYDNGLAIFDLPIVIYGDVDGNGKIDKDDITALQKHLIRSSILGGPYLRAADVNHDETVDIMDMIRLIQYVSDDAKITQED